MQKITLCLIAAILFVLLLTILLMQTPPTKPLNHLPPLKTHDKTPKPSNPLLDEITPLDLKSAKKGMLTEAQKNLVRYICDEEWVKLDSSDEEIDRNFDKALEKISTPALHYHVCENFQWLAGEDCIKLLIDHPHCDYGTALLLYWMGEPATHYEIRARRLKEGKSELFNDANKVLKYIEKKLGSNDFKTHLIAVDPKRVNKIDFQKALSNPKLINKKFMRPSNGQSLPDLNYWD